MVSSALPSSIATFCCTLFFFSFSIYLSPNGCFSTCISLPITINLYDGVFHATHIESKCVSAVHCRPCLSAHDMVLHCDPMCCYCLFSWCYLLHCFAFCSIWMLVCFRFCFAHLNSDLTFNGTCGSFRLMSQFLDEIRESPNGWNEIICGFRWPWPGEAEQLATAMVAIVLFYARVIVCGLPAFTRAQSH